MTVHNRGTEDGPGIGCPEWIVNDELKGACIAPACTCSINHAGGVHVYSHDCRVHFVD